MIIGTNYIANIRHQSFGRKGVEERTRSKRSLHIPGMLASAILILSPCSKAEINSTASNPTNDTVAVITYSKSALGKERKGDYTGAIEDYDKIIKLRPQNSFFYQLRGEAYYNKGNFVEAIRNYAIATSKYIHKKEALESQLRASTNSDDTDKLNDDIEAYENAIKLNMERIRTFRKVKRTGIDYTKVRDLDIEEVHQSQMMNCYFLALLSKFPDLIKKSGCLKWNKDGSAEVSLYPVELDGAKRSFYVKGERKTYHISNEELNSTLFKFTKDDGTKIPFRFNPAQDITLKAMEIGFLENLNGDFLSCNNGGDSADVAKMLFGSHIIPNVGRVVTGQSAFDRNDIKNGIYIAVPAQNGKYKSGSKKPIEVCGYKFVPNHTYIVNGYNEADDTVSLSSTYYDDRDTKEDDIVIPFEEIVKNHFHLDFIIPEKGK